MPDGTNPNTWVGKWFEPKVSRFYKVPENAAQYSEYRGKAALCKKIRSNAHGMHWAYLVVADDELEGWVRTCYMDPTPVDL
jgi:hypothetical protein